MFGEGGRERQTDRQRGGELQTGMEADVYTFTFGGKTGNWKLSAPLARNNHLMKN